jgi:hypothetical protein
MRRVPAIEVEGKVARGHRGSTSVSGLQDRRRATRLKSTAMNRDRRPSDDPYLVAQEALERQLEE